MVFQNGAAAYAARHNQLDRRYNGVIDFEVADYQPGDGPLAVVPGNSGSRIELEIDGGAARIGRDRYDFEPSIVGLEDGPSDGEHRTDLIYASSGDSITKLTGEPGDNSLWTLDGDGEPTELAPVGAQAALPEPQSGANIDGTLLAAVTVPPETAESGAISMEHIHDLRRPALDPPREGFAIPNVSSRYTTLSDTAYRPYPITCPGGHSVEIWMYMLTTTRTNGWPAFTDEDDDDVYYCIVDLDHPDWEAAVEDRGSVRPDDDHVLYARPSGEAMERAEDDASPVFSVDVPETEDFRRLAIRVHNRTTFNFGGVFDGGRVGHQTSYTIQPTSEL